MAPPYQAQSLPVRCHRRTHSIRRVKSTPTLCVPPRAPRCPPELDSDYLTRVTAPPPTHPISRSSCALREEILCGDAGTFEIVIQPPSPRASLSSSSFASSSSSDSSTSSTSTVVRRRVRAKTALRNAMGVVLSALVGTPHRRAEERIEFDLCT
ncbi:hypothetical protein K488DRAFT_72953 [Vararia minispora EC-137]|uniref:Uncharacterized protein n=1 Tax=Vararia minispora EC-137 TaxID=1314806 RepID=A0ACB8QCR9_9AGAM|nr:hypothetical protein K488DRAFT_72953 [Vararia minispora EC-137]